MGSNLTFQSRNVLSKKVMIKGGCMVGMAGVAGVAGRAAVAGQWEECTHA
jgi:hypothetical protein